MMKTYIGIDPGKTGGVVSIDYENNVNCHVIPKIGNQIDLQLLQEIFVSYYEHGEVICVMEQIHAIFGSSAKSTFSFGEVYGMLQGMIIANRFPLTLVQPKIWQKEMLAGVPEIKKPSSTKKTMIKNTKAMAEIAYKRLFPQVDLYLTEKYNKSINVHDGLCDALLIAEWGRRNNL